MININTNLKHKIMALRFAMWDLHLYLDTHDCENARHLMEKYKKQYEELLDDYICKYGPLTAMGKEGEKWLCTSFPWVNSGSDC